MATINPFDFFIDEYAREFPFKYDPELKEELTPYLKASEPGPLHATRLSAYRFLYASGVCRHLLVNLSLTISSAFLLLKDLQRNRLAGRLTRAPVRSNP